jgi:hypothetical protein
MTWQRRRSGTSRWIAAGSQPVRCRSRAEAGSARIGQLRVVRWPKTNAVIAPCGQNGGPTIGLDRRSRCPRPSIRTAAAAQQSAKPLVGDYLARCWSAGLPRDPGCAGCRLPGPGVLQEQAAVAVAEVGLVADAELPEPLWRSSGARPSCGLFNSATPRPSKAVNIARGCRAQQHE